MSNFECVKYLIDQLCDMDYICSYQNIIKYQNNQKVLQGKNRSLATFYIEGTYWVGYGEKNWLSMIWEHS